jgi:hypothetical protein
MVTLLLERKKEIMDPHNRSFKNARHQIERVQLGVRMEKRLVKVLKAIAEFHDLTLGDLLEGIVLHAFEGKSPFNEEVIERIQMLKEVYGMDYDASASHHLVEGAQDHSA